MIQDKIEIMYNYDKRELNEIIKKLVTTRISIDKKELEKTFKQSNREIHIFKGVLKCNECGGNMFYNERYKGYKCANSQKIRGRCTSHSIKEEYLLEAIKESITDCLENNIDIEELYKMENKKAITADAYKKELKKIQRELQKIESQFEVMYSEEISGITSYRNFENLMRALQKKQQFLIIKQGNVESLKLKNEDESEIYYQICKEEVDKILGFKDINREFIEALVDKIVISENKALREKKVDIYYRFKG